MGFFQPGQGAGSHPDLSGSRTVTIIIYGQAHPLPAGLGLRINKPTQEKGLPSEQQDNEYHLQSQAKSQEPFDGFQDGRSVRHGYLLLYLPTKVAYLNPHAQGGQPRSLKILHQFVVSQGRGLSPPELGNRGFKFFPGA
jgi:hypothetical protein